MADKSRKQLEMTVALSVREYSIGSVLFRHAVGDRLGINVTDMECLGILFFKGIATPSELSHYTGLSSGATTAMLDRLEKSGLIKRQPNPQDRRGTYIVIVKKAAKRVEPLFVSARHAQNNLMAGYSEQELALLADFFQRSNQIWEQERAKLKNIPKKNNSLLKAARSKKAKEKRG